MTLVTTYGVWASTDHRLTVHPTGALITDASVKHVAIRCRDGAALVSYTGLGRLGRLDVSEWMRQVLRGEGRTVDESLIDLRLQATARLGPYLHSLGVPHAFLAGAYLSGGAWAVEIRNVQPPTPLIPGGVRPTFDTAAVPATEPTLLVGGAGRDAVSDEDRELLRRVTRRRPRRPEDFMRLLGDVNRRAAESGRPGASTISKSATVVYMPTSGDGIKREWYGPEEERHLAPSGFSHLLFGIDIGELLSPMVETFQQVAEGGLSEAEMARRFEAAAQRAVTAKGRRDDQPSGT